MDSRTVFNWVNPLSVLGVIGVIFIFISLFDEISLCKQNCPRWDIAPDGTSGAILFAYVPQKGTPGLTYELIKLDRLSKITPFSI